MPPLDAGVIDRAIARESASERAWRRLPVLGWIVADWMWTQRNRSARQALLRQLESRAETVWEGTPEFRRFAAEVCEIAREEMGWSNARFVPEDPYRVVFWAYVDGLDLEAAMMAIEGRFGVVALVEADVERWAEGSLGGFIEELFARRGERRADPADRHA